MKKKVFTRPSFLPNYAYLAMSLTQHGQRLERVVVFESKKPASHNHEKNNDFGENFTAVPLGCVVSGVPLLLNQNKHH